MTARLKPLYGLMYGRLSQPIEAWEWYLRADLVSELARKKGRKPLAERVFWWSVWYYLAMSLAGYSFWESSSPLFGILL